MSEVIDVTREDLYELSLDELQSFKQEHGTYRGRFVQLFLALKFYQSDLPSVRSGQSVSSGILQDMVDELFRKASRPDDDCVVILFDRTYKPLTGMEIEGRKSPTNTWRNNINLQKGVICYASDEEMTDPAFLNEPRRECAHIICEDGDGQDLEGCACGASPRNTGYRREAHQKWLQKKQDGSYAVADLSRIPVFRDDYLVPNGEYRIPLVPLLFALYYDSSGVLEVGAEGTLDTLDFAADFNFTIEELQAYFDDDRMNPHNHSLVEAEPGLEWTVFQDFAHAPAPEPEGGDEGEEEEDPIPQPVLGGTPAPPPAVNPGFEPERYVAELFEEAGWDVDDVSRQRVGYDLHVSRRGYGTRYVEVKSSVGACTPVLTAREWRQALRRGEEYVLAVIDDFDPAGENSVHWIRDPADRCEATKSTTVQYSLPRSSWSSAVDDFDGIVAGADT